MRIALLLAVVVGCAKSAEKAAMQESKSAATGTAPEQTEVTDQPKGGGAAQAPAPDPSSTDSLSVGGAPPPPPPPNGPTRGVKGNGDSQKNIDQARATGVLGPADQRAFQVNAKVSVKSSTLKALDETVRGKLEPLQACYDKALQFQDTLIGELTIALRAGKATIAKSTLKHAELERCVLDVIAAATLPQGKGTLVLAFARE
jgi:hypothetical protein